MITGTNAKQVNSMSPQQGGRLGNTAAKVGRFSWHFVQMLVAMMLGMGVFHVLAGRATEANRVLWYAGMELSMVPPMIALMLFQGHGWRSSAEMAIAMLAGPAVLLACAQLGLHNYIPGLSRNTLLSLADATMFLGMLGAMLYRRDMYSRPHARHRHTGAAQPAATTHTAHSAHAR